MRSLLLVLPILYIAVCSAKADQSVSQQLTEDKNSAAMALGSSTSQKSPAEASDCQGGEVVYCPPVVNDCQGQVVFCFGQLYHDADACGYFGGDWQVYCSH